MVYNARWNEAINVVNLTSIAELIARSALMREESRGRTTARISRSRPALAEEHLREAGGRGGRHAGVFVESRRVHALQPPETTPATTPPAGAKA